MRVTNGTDGLRAARPGERWVVRVRQPDGSASDVVGWLAHVDASAGEVVLDGPVDPGPTIPGPAVAPRWRVRLDDVVVARRAPAALGGPAVGRTTAADLDRLGVEAWAVALEPLGAWTLRSASGFTGRANSCLAVGDPGRPVAEAAEAVEAYAAAHGIAPMAQVVTGSAEDAALRAVGWTETYVATDVLATGLAGLVGDGSADARVLVSEELTDAWRAAFDAYRRSDAPAVVTRLLDGRRPRAFARVEVAGEVVAIGRGHLAQGWLGIAGVWVDPAHRRQGLGTAVVRGLGRWAARRSARWCYLQVETANGPAHAAYAALGFVPHHRYHYLAPP